MLKRLFDLAQSCRSALERRPELHSGIAGALVEMLVGEFESKADSDPDPMSALTAVFGLSEFECDVLTVAAAADLDIRFGSLFGLLTGEPGRAAPTVSLTLELCGAGSLSATGRRMLTASGSLRAHRLVEVDGTRPELLQQVWAGERVVQHLLGNDDPDPGTAALLVEGPGRRDEQAEVLANAIGAGVRLGHVRSAAGTSGAETARGAFALLGVGSLTVDFARGPAGGDEVEPARTAAREAGLLGRGLVVTGADAALVRDRTLLSTLASAVVPVIVVDDLTWDPRWTQRPVVSVAATWLSSAERTAAWRDAAGGHIDDAADGWSDLVSLRMSADDIAGAAQSALVAAVAHDEALTVGHLQDAARGHGGNRLQTAATRTLPRATLADLILPDETRRSVHELVSWARNRESLLDAGQLMGRGTKGRGLVALFAGSPGTGKTLAAEAIAGELGLELYTVDLSAVIDKYIGETEKHLEQIIGQAENLNVLLFFDEADALFGSRSAAGDARDRYANQEVSYLLQRIERFEGLAVLATNFAGNVDKAFMRRLHHVITFTDPKAETRRSLWFAHLREIETTDDNDPIDVQWLADTIDLAGGDIRNIVMTAAFTAAGESPADAPPAPLGMRHILFAVKRNYQKLGMRPPALPD